MPKVKHIKTVTTRGVQYHYFGRLDDEGKTVYDIPVDVAAPNFWSVYASLVAGRTRRKNLQTVMTVERMAGLYEKSADFKALSANSQKLYRFGLAKIVENFGKARPDNVEQRDVSLFMDMNADQPGTANVTRSVLTTLYKWARLKQYTTAEPTRDIKKLKVGEHEPWPPALLERALTSNDDRVRLATHLLYFTGQRISDVVNMRWSDIDGQHITVIQQKTGKELDVPIHSRLQAELDATPRKGFYILGKYDGRKIGPQPIRIALKKFAVGFVPHGLRKNAVIALLEAGCSENEVGGITGQSPQMVRHYAKRINQKTLGGAAILKWEKKV